MKKFKVSGFLAVELLLTVALSALILGFSSYTIFNNFDHTKQTNIVSEKTETEAAQDETLVADQLQANTVDLLEESADPLPNDLMLSYGANTIGSTILAASEDPITSTQNAVPTETGYDIIIVAGQSNAAGSGRGDPEYPQEVLRNMGKVFQLGRYGADDMKIIPAVEPLQHHGRESFALAYGFALPMAAHLRANTPAHRKILIIPAAKGGSHIRLWDERKEFPNEQVVLYPDMIERVRYVMSLPGTHRVVAFTWQHGESSITAATDPDLTYWYEALTASQTGMRYAAHLGDLMARVRRDIPGDYPILIGQMVRSWPSGDRAVYASTMRSAQAQAAATDKKAAVVSSHNLTSNRDENPNAVDINHFSAKAQTILGKRYFDALQSFQQ